jgi:hypothetical protein
MQTTQRKDILLHTIAAIQNEIWLQKIENFVAELQSIQDTFLLQFSTPIYPVFDIEQAIITQAYKPENVKTIGGFWQLSEENDANESISELLAQLTA